MKSRIDYLNSQKWLSKPRIICGIMSGTSMDGIDVALTRFKKTDKFEFDLLHFNTFDFSQNFIENLKELILSKNNVNLISKLNFQISNEYLKALYSLIKDSDFSIDDIDLIGIHGQTVWHEPNSEIPNTLQLANPTIISQEFAIPVVFDFRSADIIAEGQGAPLVPIFDYHFLKSNDKNRIALNIGGISNITYLPKNNTKVIAFDTGPGNILIDYYTQKFFNKSYDENGELARKGNKNHKLLGNLMSIPHIKQKPPKSTGRELFNHNLVENILSNSRINNIQPLDLINTLTNFTVESIVFNIESFTYNVDEIIVSGGGTNNKFMMELLRYKSKSQVINSAELGLSPDAKEAIAFAFLAYLNIAQIPGNIPSVTGAKKQTILGSISFPF